MDKMLIYESDYIVMSGYTGHIKKDAKMIWNCNIQNGSYDYIETFRDNQFEGVSLFMCGTHNMLWKFKCF